MELNQLKGALEAVLFAHGEPVSTARLADVFEMDELDTRRFLLGLFNVCLSCLCKTTILYFCWELVFGL